MKSLKKYTDSTTNISGLIYVGYEGEKAELEKKIEALLNDLRIEYSIGDIVIYCYELNYFKSEIQSGNIDVKETDPDKHSMLIKRESWGEIDQDNPLDYYNLEEKE